MRNITPRMVIFLIGAVIVDVILMNYNVSIFTLLFVNFIVIFVGYILVTLISNQRWINILDEDCDPELFITKCEKMRKNSRKIEYQNVCSVNIAVGLIALGCNDMALKALNNVSVNVKNSKIFNTVYHLTLFCAYLNMDNLDKATDEYENHLKALREGILDPKRIFSLDASIMEYHYKLNKTEETARFYLNELEHLQNSYSKNFTKRQTLEVAYVRAGLLKEIGNRDEAIKNYEYIANHGNHLWIAAKSKEILRDIKNN